MKTHLLAAAAVLATLALAACQAPKLPTEADPTPGMCKPEAANALFGKDRISDAQARTATGATLVRQIQPGLAVTMDFRPERVTIETDPATGKIVRAACG